MELSPEAVEVLQDGRRRVMAGWCQGYMRDNRGSVCAYGALTSSHDPFEEWSAVVEALYALEDEVGLTHAAEGKTVAIADWNDAPERTQADVVALYDRVLANASA